MSGRNAIELYSAQLARKQQQLARTGPIYQDAGRPCGPVLPAFSEETQAKIAAALAKEMKKIRVREEERRRRDPAYRPDAIELSQTNLLPFDVYEDYYKQLRVDQFASAAEIKAAYRKLSLELHPDKQVGSRP